MFIAAKKRGLAGVLRGGEDFTELVPLDKKLVVLDGGYISWMHPRRGGGHPPVSWPHAHVFALAHQAHVYQARTVVV